MHPKSSLSFKGVREWDNKFLALFPHRFDYIWAEHPNLGAAIEWKTESRHPLSDRLIYQGTYLYGVRFGAETNYCLLDIDTNSAYHPKQDAFAISRIAAALEPLGLVNYIACTSSYSSGLHLYFPFQQTQSSWQLAIAITCLLENAGLKLQPGQLEVFPNPKPYATNGNLSLFNAHRLPLQIGSYLLNEEFQPTWSDHQRFVSQWNLVQQQNDVDSKSLKQILKQAKRRHFGISGKAEKFVNDLNAEIELGWTGPGQTNRLLGRITMRAYIFHHVLSGGEPLQGKTLIDEIVETAQSLPGYSEWCRHQHEIEHRAEEWARCIENSHYFHFGEQSKKQKPETQNLELMAAVEQAPSWNERQSAATRDRIRRAIAELLNHGHLPSRPTARFQTLLKYGIGGASLYRHRDLWHPNYFDINSSEDSTSQSESLENNAANWHSSPSLLPTIGGDSPPAMAFNDCPSSRPAPIVSNSPVNAGSPSSTPTPLQGVQYDKQALFNREASQEAFQEASRLAQSQHQRIQSQAAQHQQIKRMQQFLDSDDPILIAEAMAWAQVNQGILQINPLQLSLLTHFQLEMFNSRSSILMAIETQLGRLQWSDVQVCHALQQHFGQSHLEVLNDAELLRWLEWLRHAS